MGFLRWTGLLVVAVIFLGLATGSGVAQAQDGGRIASISVQGTQRIEAETVKSYLTIAEGDNYDSDRVNRSLKALFNTGLFADVSIRREGTELVVRVVENPIINRIAFEGNRRIKDEQLQTEVQLRPRTVYTRTKAQADVKRVLELYRRSGRFAATVEPKIIQLEQNRVDLVFEISEGQPTFVRRISFVGNQQYDASRLGEVLQTKEERWYRFLSSDDTYDPDRVTYDRELLRRFYLKRGFADFRVASAVAELTPNREGFFLTYTVEEGERYKFGKSLINAALKDLKVEDLQPLVVSEEGDWYNADQVEDIVQKLTDAVGTKGYAFVDIRPQVNRNRETRIVDVTYDIQEGPRVFVERIDIVGNVRTLDKVVRREFRLVEGDAFNSAKLRRSKQRLRDINFFEKVEVTNTPSENAPDRTVIKVEVEEKSTGELTFGVGWSSQVGPMMEAVLRERNLLGRGQDIRLGGMLGLRRSSLDLSFTEPYFLDRDVAAGFDLFAIDRKLQQQSSYNSSSIGGDLRIGYQLTDNMRQDWRYMLKRDEVKGITTLSPYVLEQLGTSVTSSVMQTLTYDRRDSRIEPTEGYYMRGSTEFAGLGGDVHLLRGTIQGGHYWPLAEKVVLSLSGAGTYVYGLSERVRITDRVYAGGDNLRGFASGGVSPRDKNTGDAIGGIWMATGSAQVRFPIGLPEEFGVLGEAFTDFGTVGETDVANVAGVEQSSSMRASVGVGVSWKSPMGPVSIDLGFPIMKETFDKKEMFKFNLGTRF
ncbi:outer membrane protein assembly factor BamA [Paramagnetospirillum marisnigri]|uniref:Outer membrane protein assembly factor BamA n=1 Tax=Paramagnetospirillum marisnigri TaxID=1285242 RepID=A0A178M7E2_9PROT|nr:outer membrane protein assembly factor BamA [Paramagnetospirillum marisnigri]OAN43955.1 outer membrane protein assembly factor BamA [Paramagnetospirillum marisnigri]